MSVPLAMALLSATAITPASAQVLTSTQSKTHDVSKEGGFVHDPGELVYSFKTSKGDGADAGGSGTACRHFDKPWPDGAGPHSTCGYTGHAASTPDSISSVFIDIDKAQPALKGSSDADHPYGGPLVLVRSRGGNGGACHSGEVVYVCQSYGFIRKDGDSWELFARELHARGSSSAMVRKTHTCSGAPSGGVWREPRVTCGRQQSE